MNKMALAYIVGHFLFWMTGLNSLIGLNSILQPQADTIYGKIFGLYKKSFNGHVYRSFEGIPYALPMNSENRFKESSLWNKSWKGVLNATTQAAPCLHYNQFHKNDEGYCIIGEEDCLHLNVYTQDDSPSADNKAVIINFHPGGFGQTSSAEISPEYLMDRPGIILVTFNYRLGPLGFLSTGDSVVLGNNGLKDQVVLMKWVQKNINAFGGNSSQITLLGLSAGGASIMFHMLSRKSKDLFHGGISVSGSALCPWALVHDVPQKTRKLADLVGCPSNFSTPMVQCLRQRPAHVIVKQMKHFQTWLYNPFTIFGPVIEPNTTSSFMFEHPVDTLNSFWPLRPIEVPWIVSVTSDEGLYPGAEFVFNSTLLSYLDANWENLASSLLFFNDTIPQSHHDKISKTIRKQYLKDYTISINSRKELIHMLTDRLFTAPNVNSAIAVAKKSRWPVYFYMYSQNNSVSLSYLLSGTKTVIGSSHGDDYSLVLKLQGLNTKKTKEDREMSEILMNIIVEFAKKGEVPSKLKWPKVSKKSSKFAYLDFRAPNDIQIKNDATLGNRLAIADLFKHDKSAKFGKDL